MRVFLRLCRTTRLDLDLEPVAPLTREELEYIMDECADDFPGWGDEERELAWAGLFAFDDLGVGLEDLTPGDYAAITRAIQMADLAGMLEAA